MAGVVGGCDVGLWGDWVSFLEGARPRAVRGYLEWAEAELRIPDGPYKGLRFEADRQPFVRLWLRELERGVYRRRVFVGPQQCGKSLVALGIPLLYGVFELRETTVCGVPDANMVRDKWSVDLLPMIEASSYAGLLPLKGPGSRGGVVTDSVSFLNGVTLRFMTGGGGDKARAGFTGRILCVTEVDGFDERGGASKEANKLKQLEGRLRAYGEGVGILPEETLECTVTDEAGTTWREYLDGTASRLAMPCEHCGAFVTLGREDLVGWEDARSVLEARELARFVCCGCKQPWTEEGRRAAARDSVLVHEGQWVDERGVVQGEPKATDTLGFRVSAVDNLFKTMGDLGVEEWRARKSPDEEGAEREMRQWVWAVPTELAKREDVPLSKVALLGRQLQPERGVCPRGTVVLGVGLDLGRHFGHYVMAAGNAEDGGHVAHYGVLEVQGAALGDARAVKLVIGEAVELFMQGLEREDGGKQGLGALVIDRGWMTDVVAAEVYAWRKKGVPVFACKGFGATERGGNAMYAPPKARKENNRYLFLGEDCFEERRGWSAPPLLNADMDAWKTRVMQGWAMELGEPMGWSLFPVGHAREHGRFVNHLLAERKVEEFKVGKAPLVYWERVRHENHFLDAMTLGAIGCHVGRAHGRWKV